MNFILSDWFWVNNDQLHFFPFIFFYSQNLIEQAKIFFKKREIYFLVIMIIAYVIGILFFSMIIRFLTID